MPRHLHWFQNDGGPLLIIPEPAAPYWEGGDPPSNGRVVEATFRYDTQIATDYDRACDVNDWVGALEIGPSWGVVLGNTTSASAAWLAGPRAEQFYAVGVDATDDDSSATLLTLATSQRNGAWRRVLTSAEVTARGLLLLHAASRGGEVQEQASDTPGTALIGDGIRHAVPPGRFAVEACTVGMPQRTFVTFVRFTLSHDMAR